MARTKVTLQGTELDIRASDAQAVAHYIVELDTANDGSVLIRTNGDARMLADAVGQVPKIGDRADFDRVNAAPEPSDSKDGQQYASHDLRVCRQRAYVAETNNGNKPFVDVYYASKPRPVIEFGSSAVQQKTQTYLTDESAGILPSDSSDPTFRKQMVLDYTAKANTIISPNFSGPGQPGWPPADIPYLKTVAEGSMFRFGASIRISSWWFNDEAGINDFQDMERLYVACTNRSDLFFKGDDQRWLCTSLPSLTNDGGWMTRVTGEFVYSPYGWDTYTTYVDPFLNAPAILSQQTLQALYRRGVLTHSQSGLIPSAFPEQPADATRSSSSPSAGTGAGAGRFPQQLCRPMRGLIGFLSDSILAATVDLDQVLRDKGGPQLPDIPDTGVGAISGDVGIA